MHMLRLVAPPDVTWLVTRNVCRHSCLLSASLYLPQLVLLVRWQTSTATQHTCVEIRAQALSSKALTTAQLSVSLKILCRALGGVCLPYLLRQLADSWGLVSVFQSLQLAVADARI